MSEDTIDIRELIKILWNDKGRIIKITTVFAIFSVFYALSVPNQFTATSILAPAEQHGSGLSKAMSQLRGINPFQMLSLGRGSSTESQIAQEIMISRSFIENFIKSNDLSVELLAVKEWIKKTDSLIINEDLFDVENKVWLIEDEAGALVPPSGWSLFQAFKNKLFLEFDPVTGLLSVSMTHYSPHIALEWLEMYIEAINLHMQTRQVEKLTRNIEYLQTEIAKTSIAEMQEVFYTVIEEQTKSKMLAQASPEYVFVVVSPAVLPERKSRPNRALLCILITFFGGTLSVLYSLGMFFYKSK